MQCPNCSGAMNSVAVIVGGGVWLCDSFEWMDQYVKLHRGELEPRDLPRNRDCPLHTVVSSKGYLRGRWPKQGQWCPTCKTVVIVDIVN